MISLKHVQRLLGMELLTFGNLRYDFRKSGIFRCQNYPNLYMLVIQSYSGGGNLVLLYDVKSDWLTPACDQEWRWNKFILVEEFNIGTIKGMKNACEKMSKLQAASISR